MKKHISLILISTFMILFNSPLCAMNPTEEEFKSTLLKIRGIFESRRAYSKDRLYRMIVHSLALKQDPQEGLKSVLRNFGLTETSENSKRIPNYIEQEKMTASNNIESLNTVLEWTTEAEKEPSFTFAGTDLFEKLYNSRWAFLDTRLKRKCEGTPLFSILPKDIERESNSFNRETAIRVREAFQERERVLVLLYPFIDLVYLADDTRLGLSLDKGLSAKLSKETKEMGDPDSAFETFPFSQNLKTVKVVYPKPIDTATKATIPQKVQKIRGALQERDPLAVYFRNVIRETAKDIYIDVAYVINWDALQKVPFQNQANFVKVQGFKLKAPPLTYSALMDQVTKKQLEEKEKKKQQSVSPQPKPSQPPLPKKKEKPLRLEEMVAPQLQLELQQQQQPQGIPETPQPPVKPAIPSESTTSLSDEQTKPKRSKDPNYKRPEKPSREEKREAFEKALTMEPVNPTSSKMEGTEQPKVFSLIRLSKTTLDVLSKLYGLGEYKSRPASELDWKDFVAAYKELREKVDGILDAKVLNKSGATRKLSGGPLQGKKMKARSFGIHEPHPTDGHTLGRGQMDRIAKHFQEKFSWTLETLGFPKEQ